MRTATRSRRPADDAWTRVVAIVAQPGVDFDDRHVLDYDSAKAASLGASILRHRASCSRRIRPTTRPRCTRRARARPLRGAEGRPRADVRVARGAVRADLHRGRADRRRRAAPDCATSSTPRCARSRALGTVLPWRRNRAAARAPVQLQRPDPLLLAAAGRRGRGRATVRQPCAAAGAGNARRAVVAGRVRSLPRGRPRERAARVGAPPDTRRDRALCARVRNAAPA